jgi:putative phage-type endonuclease
MRLIDCTQGTDAWKAARLGKLTASRIHDAVARTKTGWGASRANYMAELIAERLTGVAQEGYTNAAMQHGTATEPEARAAYEFFANVDVVQVGFVLHPDFDDCGASPDGLIGDDGVLEIKCPNTATHLETLLTCAVADKYVKQAMWQMTCTGRRWVDFCSYDPRMPERMRLWVSRIERDEEKITQLEFEAVTFLDELHQKLRTLEARYGTREPLPLLMAG